MGTSNVAVPASSMTPPGPSVWLEFYARGPTNRRGSTGNPGLAAASRAQPKSHHAGNFGVGACSCGSFSAAGSRMSTGTTVRSRASMRLLTPLGQRRAIQPPAIRDALQLLLATVVEGEAGAGDQVF